MNRAQEVAGEAGGAACGVIGVGVDIASVAEVRQALSDFGEEYLNRLFTSDELSRCRQSPDPARQLAGFFAAKEAVVKVLPGDEPRPPWTSIEVRPREEGGFELRLLGPAAHLAEQHGIGTLAVSLSREGDMATAVVFAMSAK
jgi:holo-[acyl-carrier protein] synthase